MRLLPACVGMATYHLRSYDFAQAVVYADRGLALADGLGAFGWAIHRLLPLLCEALIALEEFGRAAQLSERLREQSHTLEHPLGLAYADATDAILRHFRDHQPDASAQMLLAAARMEAVPVMFPASRTVDAHLRAIFVKLAVDSRGAVADVVRRRGLGEVEARTA